MKIHRPAGVKFLAVLLISAALWYALRLVEAILYWNVLAEYHAKGGPLYIAVSGVVWAILASVVGWAVWQGKPWAWGAALGLSAGLGSWAWYDQLLVQTARTNEPFNLILTILWLIVACLSLFSKNIRNFYHER